MAKNAGERRVPATPRIGLHGVAGSEWKIRTGFLSGVEVVATHRSTIQARDSRRVGCECRLRIGSNPLELPCFVSNKFAPGGVAKRELGALKCIIGVDEWN